MIKNAVITRANLKVKEDEQIQHELEMRLSSEKNGDKRFQENIASRYNSLPDLP